MAKKQRRGKKPLLDEFADLPEGTRAWIALREQMQRDAREAYEEFFRRAKDLPPIERAEAWLRHVADHPDNDGDLEAIIYLASRGHDCAKGLCINNRFTIVKQCGMVDVWSAPLVERTVFGSVTRDYHLF